MRIIVIVLSFLFIFNGIIYKQETTYNNLITSPKYAITTLVIENNYTGVNSNYLGNNNYKINLNAYSFNQFYGQMQHELCHLKNIDLYDVYVEGICSFYAKLKFDELHLSFDEWYTYYNQTINSDVYARSFYLMEELYKNNINVFSMFDYLTIDKKAIDINGWINSFDKQKQITICNILREHYDGLYKVSTLNFHQLYIIYPNCI